jgi:hypothetical protein
MNANELADKLLGSLTMEYDCDKYMEQAATMLRQQQAEIEALKHWQDTWRPFLKKHFGICNGFCGEYECKENQDVCKRKAQEK